MIEVRQTAQFKRWLKSLRDIQAQARIARRIERIEQGNFGDYKSVSGGVSELRFTFGPGYRVYFIRKGDALVILIGGGDKASQNKDIQTAIEMAKEL